MKKSPFTESQIVAVLKEGEAGVPVAQLTRKHGISAVRGARRPIHIPLSLGRGQGEGFVIARAVGPKQSPPGA